MSVTFGLSDVGLDAATVAASTGPKIEITSFALTDSLVPFDKSVANPPGNLLYTGSVYAVQFYDDNTADVICKIPTSAGPFQFGDIRLYLSDGTYFARAVYTSLQDKLSQVVNGVGSVWTYHCLIRLANVSAILNYTYQTWPSIPVIDAAVVVSPLENEATAILAMDYTPESTAAKSPILIVRRDATSWTPRDWRLLSSAAVAGTGSGPTKLVNAIFDASGSGKASLTSPANRYLVQNLTTGQIVTGSSDGAGNMTFSRTVNWVVPGSSYAVYDFETTSEEAFTSPRRVSPTPLVVDDNSTYLATTQWYMGQGSATAPLMDGAPSVGTSKRWARQDHVHPTDTSRAPVVSPALTGVPTAPTAAVNTNTTQIATTAFVIGQAAATAPQMDGVAAVGNSLRYAREDHVHPSDSTKASSVSPNLTGVPTAPTAPVDTNTTQLATTAFVLGQAGTASPLMDGVATAGTSYRYSRQDHRHPTDTSRAPLDSPNLTGVPTAPTAAAGTSTSQIATTSYVVGMAANSNPLMDGAVSIGSSTRYARQDHVHPTDTSRAAVNSPALTGVPTAPTAALNTNTAQIATTAFVLNQASDAVPTMNGAGAAGTSESYSRANHVHPTDTSRAPVASPSFTGTPVRMVGPDTLELGFRDIPVAITAPAALTPDYRGRMVTNIASDKGGSGAIMVPQSAWGGIGASIFNIFNNSATNSITVAMGSGLSSLNLLGRPTVASGSRLVGPLGMATLFLLNNGTQAYITGVGVS